MISNKETHSKLHQILKNTLQYKRQRIHPPQTLLLHKDTALSILFTSERSILEQELWKLEQKYNPHPIPRSCTILEVLGGAKSTTDTTAQVSLVFLAIQLKHLTISLTESLIISAMTPNLYKVDKSKYYILPN